MTRISGDAMFGNVVSVPVVHYVQQWERLLHLLDGDNVGETHSIARCSGNLNSY